MKLVSLLGTSPGTPHTTICILEQLGHSVRKHIIVATKGAALNEAITILTKCPCPATGKPPASTTAIETITLPYNDIKSQEHLQQLRQTLAKILDTDTILDITGGRKIMAVAASLEALNHGATIITTTIPDQLYQEIKQAKQPCNKTAPEKAKILKLT